MVELGYMFLATKELIKEKARFILITVVIILVGYLTFFLTSLAYGLATSYTQAIDSWGAKGIFLQEDVNNNIARSMLTKDEYDTVFDSNGMALLGVGNTTVKKNESKDVVLFGIDTNSFLAPTLSSGKSIQNKKEVIVSDELQKIGLEINDTINLKESTKKYKIVGFAPSSTFQTQPIIYMILPDWREAAADISGMAGMKDNTTVSAIVTKNREYSAGKGMVWQSIRDFNFTLPGYSAQVLTFSLMIGFLIGIAAFVLAIFMYILTLQKKNIFGVLKAEGIPSSYIARSVVFQSLILVTAGLLIGLILALLTGYLLSSKVPFMVNIGFYIGVTSLFVVCTVVGSLASVLSVTKIDPAEAIK